MLYVGKVSSDKTNKAGNKVNITVIETIKVYSLMFKSYQNSP